MAAGTRRSANRFESATLQQFWQELTTSPTFDTFFWVAVALTVLHVRLVSSTPHILSPVSCYVLTICPAVVPDPAGLSGRRFASSGL